MKKEEAKKMEVGSKDLLISQLVEISSEGTFLIFMDLEKINEISWICTLQMFTGVYGVFVGFHCNIYEKGQ